MSVSNIYGENENVTHLSWGTSISTTCAPQVQTVVGQFREKNDVLGWIEESMVWYGGYTN